MTDGGGGGGNLSQDTVHLIARMVKYDDEELMVKLMLVQHQTNGNDWVFICFSICH